MPTVTTSTLERFFNQGENEISQECNLLVDRYSIATSVGVGAYTIPDTVRSIRRITWLGKKLSPLPKREFQETFQSGTQQGRPFWYIYNNTGQNQIQLFPAPSVAIPQVVNVWDTDIINGVIVEFSRVTDNSSFILPDFCRNYLLKKYVAKKIFDVNGPSQNLRLAKYFDEQWTLWKLMFTGLLNDLIVSPRRVGLDQIMSSDFPGSPVLPIDRFGISVDTGY